MSRPRIYLDHAATTPVLPQARAAMAEALERWANPSSPHAEGRAAKAALEDARRRIKAALGWSGDLIFTATASEAAALAFRRCHEVGPKPALSTVEHDAIRSQVPEGEGWNLHVDENGLLAPDGLSTWLHLGGRGLIAVQHANSETGVVQPIAQIGEAVDAAGSFLLVDCAQSAGKLPMPPADLIIVSSSKVGGPPGAAALLVRDLKLLVPTGGQERGYRRGTENLPAILGWAAALEADAWDFDRLNRLRARLDVRLMCEGAEIVGQGAGRLPTIGAYAMEHMSAMAQLVQFDALGFAVSAGSACSSGKVKTSHVLAAMGAPPEFADKVIRVSFGPTTSEAEVDAFANAWTSLAASSKARAA
ncbi:cysteine desulfurase family protein [Sphingomonas glaciei]|uniref:Cysteine desulfurase n=1 Tax=Sphingomonas glaciei TaxID=2938948 RepID=A0ABY5MX58_9SPHN|nr:aminotransferase class V-fold PLP-dependent enzyme [Sphingomonas glaciei]UUR08549.1 aminotransferase class V-fold PLP-dependent enzyme [Sphingomonas glaciei]